MDQPPGSLLLLCTNPYSPFQGGLVRPSGDSYHLPEVRVAIRHYYELPATYPIVVDIGRVYPWLGKEWQNIFDLYALGFPVVEIAYYWSYLYGKIVGHGSTREYRNKGSRLIRRLCNRTIWLLELSTYPHPTSSTIVRPIPASLG